MIKIKSELMRVLILSILITSMLAWGKDKGKDMADPPPPPPPLSDAGVVKILKAQRSYWMAVAEAAPYLAKIKQAEAELNAIGGQVVVESGVDTKKWQLDSTQFKWVPLPPEQAAQKPVTTPAASEACVGNACANKVTPPALPSVAPVVSPVDTPK